MSESHEEAKRNNHMPGLDTSLAKIVDNIDRRIPISPIAYEPQISSLYATLGKYDVDQFDIGINPVSVISLSPSEIVKNTGRDWKPWDNRRQLVGRVMEGDWHSSDLEGVPDYAMRNPKKFTETVDYESFRDHFIYDEPWENTPIYQQWMLVARSDDDTTYTDSSSVEERLQYMDRLFDDIKSNGYRSQLEIANKSTGYLNAVLNEVNVDIGPCGEPLFVDGRHRLCIAKLLDIDKIPAFVLVRHEQWVKHEAERYS